MVTYWCTWCGQTAERPTASEAVRCGRCTIESVRLFGYWSWSVMKPLRSGEEPGIPDGARRRFLFVDTITGRRFATEPIRYPPAPEMHKAPRFRGWPPQ